MGAKLVMGVETRPGYTAMDLTCLCETISLNTLSKCLVAEYVPVKTLNLIPESELRLMRVRNSSWFGFYSFMQLIPNFVINTIAYKFTFSYL